MVVVVVVAVEVVVGVLVATRYLDNPSLLAADQLEVLAQVGAVAQKTHLNDLDCEGLVLARSPGSAVGDIHRVRGAALSPAPPRQGVCIPGHRTKTGPSEQHAKHTCHFFFLLFF